MNLTYKRLWFLQEEYDWAADSLIPEEYHVVRVSGVHGLNIEDAPNTTLTEEHEHHVTLFPSLKPTSRKEVSYVKNNLILDTVFIYLIYKSIEYGL